MLRASVVGSMYTDQSNSTSGGGKKSKGRKRRRKAKEDLSPYPAMYENHKVMVIPVVSSVIIRIRPIITDEMNEELNMVSWNAVFG